MMVIVNSHDSECLSIMSKNWQTQNMKNSLTIAWNFSLFRNFVSNETVILLKIENKCLNPSNSKNE
jgi:hypothetical protein